MLVVVKGKISRSVGHPFGQVRVQRVEGVTADSTLWTADSHCVTADGKIICVAADAVESVNALDALDAIVVAGGAVIDADVLEAAAASDLADAVSDVAADAVEAADAADALDAVTDVAVAVAEAADAADALDAAIGAQVLFGTVAEPAAAVDLFDAAVEAVEVPAVGGGVGGYYPLPRPFPVEGYGFGILPQLEGVAHGVVVVVGAGAGTLSSLGGEAVGSAGVAGRSAGQLALVRAAALGNSGQAGAATAVIKGLSVASAGAVGIRGTGAATLEIKATATGQHDDGEAAVMTFLLAA